MASVLDWALIIIYMLSMVGVGMYFKTDDSMQDFAVADKKLGLSVMTATMLATAVGGGALTGSVGNSYMNGIVEVPKIIILLCINLFMGLFVAKKMRISEALQHRKCWEEYMEKSVRHWAVCFAQYI